MRKGGGAVRVQETRPPKINLHEGESERERETEGGGRRERARKSARGNTRERERERGVPAFAADYKLRNFETRISSTLKRNSRVDPRETPFLAPTTGEKSRDFRGLSRRTLGKNF